MTKKVTVIPVMLCDRQSEYYAVGSSVTLGPWKSLGALESNVPDGEWVVVVKMTRISVTGA